MNYAYSRDVICRSFLAILLLRFNPLSKKSSTHGFSSLASAPSTSFSTPSSFFKSAAMWMSMAEGLLESELWTDLRFRRWKASTDVLSLVAELEGDPSSFESWKSCADWDAELFEIVLSSFCWRTMPDAHTLLSGKSKKLKVHEWKKNCDMMMTLLQLVREMTNASDFKIKALISHDKFRCFHP